MIRFETIRLLGGVIYDQYASDACEEYYYAHRSDGHYLATVYQLERVSYRHYLLNLPEVTTKDSMLKFNSLQKLSTNNDII